MPHTPGALSTSHPVAVRGPTTWTHDGDMKTVSALAGFVVGALLLFVPAAASPLSSDSAAPAQLRSGAWAWPLDPEPALLRAFDPPAQRWLSGHRGVDLAAGPGDGVRAPSGGIVSFVGHLVDRPVLVIDHGSGLLTSLEPVRSTLVRGAIVGPGDEVGMIGTGAHCTGRCLHWGLRLDGLYIDPMLTILDTRPSVLLPTD